MKKVKGQALHVVSALWKSWMVLIRRRPYVARVWGDISGGCLSGGQHKMWFRVSPVALHKHKMRCCPKCDKQLLGYLPFSGMDALPTAGVVVMR